MLNRDSILATKSSLRTEVVDVPEWNEKVTIRELTAGKGRELINDNRSGTDPVAFVIASVINEDGTPTFTSEDRPLLEQLSAVAIRRISNAAIILNGLDQTEEDVEKKS